LKRITHASGVKGRQISFLLYPSKDMPKTPPVKASKNVELGLRATGTGSGKPFSALFCAALMVVNFSCGFWLAVGL
jgi:predicted helicase